MKRPLQQKSAEWRLGELNGGFQGLSGAAIPAARSSKKHWAEARNSPGPLTPHFARLIEDERSQKFNLVDLIDQVD